MQAERCRIVVELIAELMRGQHRAITWLRMTIAEKRYCCRTASTEDYLAITWLPYDNCREAVLLPHSQHRTEVDNGTYIM